MSRQVMLRDAVFPILSLSSDCCVVWLEYTYSQPHNRRYYRTSPHTYLVHQLTPCTPSRYHHSSSCHNTFHRNTAKTPSSSYHHNLLITSPHNTRVNAVPRNCYYMCTFIISCIFYLLLLRTHPLTDPLFLPRFPSLPVSS